MNFIAVVFAAVVGISSLVTPATTASAVAPSAKHAPVVVKAKPAVTAKPARFTAPHVFSARVIDGYFWVVTDLPNAASSIAPAKSICHSAASHLRFSNTRVVGISVRAKGDGGRLVLVAGRAC